MYERMLDKSAMPTEEEIREYVGQVKFEEIQTLEKELAQRYDVSRDLRFPFGNGYGWGYKYSHKTQHMFYLFFEKEAFTIMMQISGKDAPKVEMLYPDLLEKTKELWDHRYPCGNGGGWIRYRVEDRREMVDFLRLLEIRKKPVRNKV